MTSAGRPRRRSFIAVRGLSVSEIHRPDLFWPKVDRINGPVLGAFGRCWPWTRRRLPRQGYGIFGVLGRVTTAHRVAYVLTNGDIDDGVVVRHVCDNPPCCNPAHLEAGTNADNARDAAVRGRLRAKLSAAHVLEIRAARAAGPVRGVYSRLASTFGVRADYVRAVAAGRGWDHIVEAVRP